MSHWPDDGIAGIPPPDLVAAWWKLDTLPTNRVPVWAAHWLVAGYDGDALVTLAGLPGSDTHSVRDILPAALTECGVSDPGDGTTTELREHAAIARAFAAIARLHLDGGAGAQWVIKKVVEIVEPDFVPWVIDQPLGDLYRLDDEWGAGWGRTHAELGAVVRRACMHQLARRPLS